jgi:predicted O-methyltransferase YrrM
MTFDELLAVDSDIKDHLPRLAQIGRESESIIELGVREGYSTRAFLHGLSERGHGHLWSVDVESLFITTSLQWAFLLGDDCDPLIYNSLPSEVDAVFIDTDHAYDHTLRELELYVPKVRKGGVVLLHDTENEDPALRGEHIGMQPPFPVAAAIEDYCNEHRLPWRNDPACWGMGTIFV